MKWPSPNPPTSIPFKPPIPFVCLSLSFLLFANGSGSSFVPYVNPLLVYLFFIIVFLLSLIVLFLCVFLFKKKILGRLVDAFISFVFTCLFAWMVGGQIYQGPMPDAGQCLYLFNFFFFCFFSFFFFFLSSFYFFVVYFELQKNCWSELPTITAHARTSKKWYLY